MVKVYLISYANDKFVKNQNRLNESARKHGINKIISYNESDLKVTKFYKKYKNILDSHRGAGYWLWKPFFIYKTMSKMGDGDILIYSDSGAIFVDNPRPLLKLALREDILLFTNNEQNIKWNKRLCLLKMGCDSDIYLNSPQVSAGFQIYVNNDKTRKFVKTWLSYCCAQDLINDVDGGCNEYAKYIEHRHDQSILTNLAAINNIPLYRDPSQGGNHLKPLQFRKKGEWLQYPYKYYDIKNPERFMYPTIINHLRNTGKIKLKLIKIHSRLPVWLKKIIRKK